MRPLRSFAKSLVALALPVSLLLPPDRALAATVGTVLQDCAACPPLVVIPGPDGGPHVAIGQTEVTFDQYAACVADGACPRLPHDHDWGRGTRPVINVTHAEATTYARWLSATTGRACRLPDETLWAHAARAGTTTAYWWGDTMIKDHANCRKCDSRFGGDRTAPVGHYPPNPWGLHDMHGNVWEWVADCAQGTPPCEKVVARGGSWYYIPQQSRSDSRATFYAGDRSYSIGFRVVCPPLSPNK